GYKRDNEWQKRLIRVVRKAMKEDYTHLRGDRRLESGNIKLLEGYDHNRHAPLHSVLMLPVQADFHQDPATATVQLQAFVPEQRIAWPTNATKARISFAVGTCVFEGADFDLKEAESALIAKSSQEHPAISLVVSLPEDSGFPLFAIVGIRCFE